MGRKRVGCMLACVWPMAYCNIAKGSGTAGGLQEGYRVWGKRNISSTICFSLCMIIFVVFCINSFILKCQTNK